MSCGGEHTVIADQLHSVYSWGDGKFGQLGMQQGVVRGRERCEGRSRIVISSSILINISLTLSLIFYYYIII